MAKTKKPTGFNIVRDGLKFTFSWKIADENYGDGQQFAYHWYSGQAGSDKYQWTKWYFIDVMPNETSVDVQFSQSELFPTSNKPLLYGIGMAVRGKRSVGRDQSGNDVYYEWSDFAYLDRGLYGPRRPSVTESLDSTYDNVCTFDWDVTTTQDEGNPVTDTEWQSILVKECNETDGSKLNWSNQALGWSTATAPINSAHTFTADSTLLSQNSYTLWFRIRSRGWGGKSWQESAFKTGLSYWRYSKHVFANPYIPRINSANKVPNQPWLNVQWTADQSYSHPLDSVDVEYTIGVPANSSLGPPNNPSWQTMGTFSDTGGTDGIMYFLNFARLELDNMMWVRVLAHHDRKAVSSSIVAVKQNKNYYCDGLTPPSNLSVTNIDASTHRATIHVQNNSAVESSRLAVIFRQSGKNDVVVGIMAHDQSEITVVCPNWGTSSISFAVYAFHGTYTTKTASGITTYVINATLRSTTVTSGGNVPVAPTNVTVNQSTTEGEAVLTWSWAWSVSTGTEISWSTNRYAWESTNQPSTYTVSKINAARWRIDGLETGKTWYFRLRHVREQDGETTYGPYCDVVSINLTSSDDEITTPVLKLSRDIVPKTSSFTASWTFTSSKNSAQTYAEICQATVDEESETPIVYGRIIAHTTTAKSISIKPPSSWQNETTHFLCVRIKTKSGLTSDWSTPVPISVASAVSCNITSTSFVTRTIGTRTVRCLTELPFTTTIAGASANGTTTLTFERAKDYHVDRPDENDFNGYKGEIVLSYVQNGASQIRVTNEDLVGSLDDGASYFMNAIVTDALGRSAYGKLLFEVHWDHQALMPNGTVEILEDYGVAKLRPIAPSGAISSDVCDIYRLSVDKPVLVYSGATFGSYYIDPYPTIGEYGGYRFVFRTKNNDYITAGNVLAWKDVPSNFESIDHIINFSGGSVKLRYNVDLSSNWTKDAKVTNYLGGSVQGDWNAAVNRKGTVTGVAVIATDQELIESMRHLAVYPGICHVRTRDGSSYDADIQVSESRGHTETDLTANFTLSISKVDSEGLDGMTYQDWQRSL